MSEETAEYKTEAKANNTAILTEKDGAINSKDYWGYAVARSEVYDEDLADILIDYQLIACSVVSNDKRVLIRNFGKDHEFAVRVLGSLLRALDNGDRVWDVNGVMPF